MRLRFVDWPIAERLPCVEASGRCSLEPPATEQEIRDASLPFVRKLSGFTAPSKANDGAFQRAVDEVAVSATVLIRLLTATAVPRDREVETEKAKTRSAERFGPKVAG